PDDSSLAGPPASLPAPLHPDQRVVAQSRRALVRPADGQTDQAGGAPKHADPRGRDPHLYRPDQHGAEALRVDEDRRRDLGQCSSILSSNLWDRTLAHLTKGGGGPPHAQMYGGSPPRRRHTWGPLRAPTSCMGN